MPNCYDFILWSLEICPECEWYSFVSANWTKLIWFLTVVDPCETIDANGEPPCQNGGVCNMTQPGNYECSCPIGYEGGKTQPGNYECGCAIGYKGLNANELTCSCIWLVEYIVCGMLKSVSRPYRRLFVSVSCASYEFPHQRRWTEGSCMEDSFVLHKLASSD